MKRYMYVAFFDLLWSVYTLQGPPEYHYTTPLFDSWTMESDAATPIAEWKIVQAEWKIVPAEWKIVPAEWKIVQAEWKIVPAECKIVPAEWKCQQNGRLCQQNGRLCQQIPTQSQKKCLHKVIMSHSQSRDQI